MNDKLVRNISDTAMWVAHYRAAETERPDAIFKDPFARALAGDRGRQIAKAQKFGDQNAWSFMARTVLFDRFVTEVVREGVDTVVNLAAGLDTRPYRIDLPKALRWIEVDLPGILDYKEEIIGSAAPVCALERVRLDLSDESARRALFARIGATSSRTAVMTEGLLIYLDAPQVESLARDLAGVASFRTWIIDLVSPGLIKMMMQRGGDMVAAAGAPFKFAPPEGPPFFEGLGWHPGETASLLKTAGRLNRLPLFLKLISLLPESPRRKPERPWSAVIRLERT
jgi:methyltransferase (TIGR00027 family)